jgi:serine/threonine protein phosphatase PrpC
LLRSYAITDIGLKRPINQDYIYASDMAVGNLPDVYIVADGMGGHNGGDTASKATVETIVREIGHSSEKNPVLILDGAIGSANAFIRERADQDENLKGMGTTVVAATCIGSSLHVANVGDSRLYVVGDSISQITVDHSFVEEMIKRGGIDRNAARNHPDKNIITRAVGACRTVDADFFHVELQPGDVVLLCTDGLTNMVEDDTIKHILKSRGSVREKAERLISEANRNGGRDNISVIVLDPFADEVEHD